MRNLFAAAILAVALAPTARAFGHRSAQDYTDGCLKRADDNDCNTIGYMYENGIDVPRDYARARDVYDLACKRGSARGCGNLGNIYRDGEGVTVDAAQAAKLYMQSCKGGEITGCANLANAYLEGEGVPRSPGKAVALFKKVCAVDPGPPGAHPWPAAVVSGCCNSLANLYERGDGVPQNLQTAQRLYRKSCDLGDKMACRNLQKLLANGPSRIPVQKHTLEYQGDGPTR